MPKKDWVGDGNSIFKQLGASSHTDEEREENDYYATDPRAIDDLFKMEEFSENIWEPASGGGHLVNIMREKYHKNVFSSDLVDRGCQDELIDFISGFNQREGDFDIITNPPFRYCTEFIIKSLELIKPHHKVAMFLKLQTLEGKDRYSKIYSIFPPKNVYVYVSRIQCGKNGEFTGTSAVCYAWFVWEKGYKGETVLKWIQ